MMIQAAHASVGLRNDIHPVCKDSHELAAIVCLSNEYLNLVVFVEILFGSEKCQNTNLQGCGLALEPL